MSVDGQNWNAFTILDAGGDAMRWARRAFHQNEYSYDQIVQLAQSAPAGSDNLLFVPYLNGERLGPHQNARAQFFGLTSGHGLAHLHRSYGRRCFRRAAQPPSYEKGGTPHGSPGGQRRRREDASLARDKSQHL